jgi:phage terminase large subunit-like protein
MILTDVPYRQWADDGFLQLTPTTRIDQQAVLQLMVSDCIDQNIRHVAFDPYAAEWLIGMLARQGIETYVVKQGVAAMSEPSKYLEAAVSEGIFQHGGNPISDWQAENVEVKRDENDNIRPVKPQHGSNKRIDGIVAAVMGICVATILDTGTGGAYSSGSIML